jgi:hypothetical protein
MKNPFKKAFQKAINSGTIIFGKYGNKKPVKLYTKEIEIKADTEYFVLVLDDNGKRYYVKPVNDGKIAVTYQILEGKEGAAVFTQEQKSQFVKDFGNRGLKAITLKEFKNTDNQSVDYKSIFK